MPVPRRVLSLADVRAFVESRCFPEGSGKLGAELEWFPTGDASHGETVAAAGTDPFPAGSALTFEPGGQVELSSAPLVGVGGVVGALDTDARELRRRLSAAGIGLHAVGIDPDRLPRRVLDNPRYAAMEAYWAGGGEHEPGAGIGMMATTASIQVCVDATGPGGHRDTRWRLAHALSPVLAACFANSPVAQGRVTGWRSTRLAFWEGLDRTRTAPALRTGNALEDWTTYLLGANVMLIRSDGRHVTVGRPFPFGRWLDEGHALGWPDADDLAYHLSTVFPPVRAKGWLELRTIDALDAPWWPVPIAVAAALLDDPEAADGAALATGRASWCWCEAPRWSLEYPPLADAATQCFDLARAALDRAHAPRTVIGAVETFQERFVDRGRCPADETLDRLSGPVPAP